MPLLNVNKTYSDLTILTESQLDTAFNSIETFLNVTKLDSSNIQTGGISNSALANNVVSTNKIQAGAVGLNELAAGIAPPTGVIMPYVAAVAPTGYLLCDGTQINRITFATLFSVVGTSFGAGDGSTTFHLPDLRGKFMRGFDDGTGNDPDAATRTAANSGGATGDNIGSSQTEETKLNSISMATDGGHIHRLEYKGNEVGGVASGDLLTVRGVGTDYSLSNSPSGVSGSNGSSVIATASDHTHALATGSETRPQNINVNYIIKS